MSGTRFASVVPPRAITGAFEIARLRQHVRLWCEVRGLSFEHIYQDGDRQGTVPNVSGGVVSCNEASR